VSFIFRNQESPQLLGEIVWRRADSHSKTVLLIVKILHRRKFPLWRRKPLRKQRYGDLQAT
jgi:hypothetical protein